MTLTVLNVQLCEAYLYYSCAQTETDSRIRGMWEDLMRMEITHFEACAHLIEKYKGHDIKDIVKADVIEQLVVFESNKDYVDMVIEEQLDLTPQDMEYVRFREIADDWSTFKFQWKMNMAYPVKR